MQLYTGCPSCNKGITTDLTHKEIYCGANETRPVAVLRCPNCRAMIDISITTATKEQ